MNPFEKNIGYGMKLQSQGTSKISPTFSKVNRDWEQVYNISLGEGSTSGGTNEGAYVV